MFIPNIKNKREINHKDGNKQNNNVSNLEWCTRRENSKHALDIGLRKTKKIEQYDKNRNFIKAWDSIIEASTELKLWHSDISKCCKGKLKTVGRLYMEI